MKKLRIRFWIVIISFSLIGFVLGSLIIINPPNNRLATNSLQNNIFWDNIKELGTVIGGLIAVFTYFRNSNSRREDVALQKFKNTIAAEDYFHREFALSINEAIAEYDRLLVYNSYDKTMDASLRAAIVRQTVKRINFAQYFKTLNRLAAYPYYDQVNEKQCIAVSLTT